MTGEKNRYKTHEQLWKLEDGELSTPQHDELVLQLLNKKNAVKFAKALEMGTYDHVSYFISEEVLVNEVILNAKSKLCKQEEILDTNLNYIREQLKPFIASHRESYFNKAEMVFESIGSDVVINNISSEVPIVGNNNFILGYIDIQLKFESIDETVVDCTPTEYDIEFLKNTWDYDKIHNLRRIYSPDIRDRTNGKLTGYGKLYRYLPSFVDTRGGSIHKSRFSECINIEVKPKIKSFGETLRQINTYRSFLPNDIIAIYSPDTRFKAAFETQGIKLISPSDLGLK